MKRILTWLRSKHWWHQWHQYEGEYGDQFRKCQHPDCGKIQVFIANLADAGIWDDDYEMFL